MHPRTRPTAILCFVAFTAVLLSACFGGGGSGNPGSLDSGRSGFVPTTTDATPVPQAQCPLPGPPSAAGLEVSLVRNFATSGTISFGLPLPSGALKHIGELRLEARNKPVDATARVLLEDHNAAGRAIGPRAVLVELPSSVLDGDCAMVEVFFGGSRGAPVKPGKTAPFSATSAASDEIVRTTERTIEKKDGKARLVDVETVQRVLFTGHEPTVMAVFPDGYLGSTGIIGHVASASQIGAAYAGLKFISDAATAFGLSAMFIESYAVNPDSVVGPDDIDEAAEVTGYEAWLYDRCATFLLFAAHTSDTRFLREGYRSCSYYAGKIELSGEDRGIFRGKPERDTKYSHLRGLYAYYALTGDEAALAAGEAVADLWLSDDEFVVPYRSGQLRGPDKLWTERLLGHSLEGLFYGHKLTGEAKYLEAAKEIVDTAHIHITGDAAALANLNPGATKFPPQNCFIHTAEQGAEGEADEPYCSGWMPALLVDALIAYQEQTDDPKVDEIFIRLTRFLRDTGTSYHKGDIFEDSFLRPSIKFDATQVPEARMLVPLYGAGIDTKGKRRHYGEYDDYLHCSDASGLTAAGIRALKRSGGYDRNPVGPFATEGASFEALHTELAFCAYQAFVDQTRPKRDPSRHAQEELEKGLADPKKYIEENRVGHPSHVIAPQRKLSWWFNSALEQFALLEDAGVEFRELRPGAIQP